MKKTLVILMAMSLLAVGAPVLAEKAPQHGTSHQAMDAQCTKECLMLLKNCAQEVDSIQDRIKKLQVEINEKGANTYTRDELRLLNSKLKEANQTLRDLQKPGK